MFLTNHAILKQIFLQSEPFVDVENLNFGGIVPSSVVLSVIIVVDYIILEAINARTEK